VSCRIFYMNGDGEQYHRADLDADTFSEARKTVMLEHGLEPLWAWERRRYWYRVAGVMPSGPFCRIVCARGHWEAKTMVLDSHPVFMCGLRVLCQRWQVTAHRIGGGR
jgi:hypothetical protein